MSREWKPGDVARIDYSDGSHDRALWTSHGDWSVPGGCHPGSRQARPLVVIDAEDREEVARLTGLYLDVEGSATDVMQAALREFANPTPPKPEEPTGLGAVVEDASGVEFIHLGSGLWAYGTTDGPSQGFTYADIAAVRLLSEGVSA